MNSSIEIYKSNTGNEITVRLDRETIWLDAHQIAELFNVQRPAIVKHIGNIYKSNELNEISTCSVLEQVAADGKFRKMNQYNLDMIISVGYRVNSAEATLFRQWATQRLKEYLIQGYAINEQRLAQKNMEIEYLKTGIRIIGRAIEDQMNDENQALLSLYARGLALLDDYDHENLDLSGVTRSETIYPSKEEYLDVIQAMHSEFESQVFAKPKDDSFDSSIHQIAQTFDGQELYPTLEEKAANLLYCVVKNHSFVDGNKRIAAACFIYFLSKNGFFSGRDGVQILSNDALASLTLFIATSKSDEAETVKRFVVSVLNRAVPAFLLSQKENP